MGPDGVVVAPPAIDEDLCLAEGVEVLGFEQLVAGLAVEAFTVTRTGLLSPTQCSRGSGNSVPRSCLIPPNYRFINPPPSVERVYPTTPAFPHTQGQKHALPVARNQVGHGAENRHSGWAAHLAEC